MMKKALLILGLVVGVISPTIALDLASALSAGKVCERADGYIQATPGNEAETSSLVDQVNAKRTQVYAGIAMNTGAQPAQVAIERAQEEKAAHPEKFCN